MKELGLSQTQLRQIVWWRTPHFLSLGVCLLFAYGVAWLLARSRQKGVWRGVITAIFLWAAVAATSWVTTGWAGLSGNLLRMEVSYTFLASVVMGAIIGGLTGKLVESSFE